MLELRGASNSVSRFKNIQFENPKGHSREMHSEPLEHKHKAQESWK